MPVFKRDRPIQATRPLLESKSTKSNFSWEDLGTASTPPARSPSLTSNFSWDSITFPETSSLWPTESNGNWQTSTADAFRHPSTTAKSLNEALQWPQVRQKLSYAAEAANEGFQGSINRAFEGHDVPAMHDKVIDLVPSISLPTRHQVSQSVDSIAEKFQTMVCQRGSVAFVDEEMDGDHLAFAHQMGQKARHALVRQGICKAWQTDATRATVHWQAQLNASLSQLFVSEKANFNVAQLFAMTPIWTGDVASKTWKLGLDTGVAEICVGGALEPYEEKRLCLAVGFELPETAGCVRVEDIERGTIVEEDWLAVL